MAITIKRAAKLRPLIDELLGSCGEFDDELATLEDTDTKGDDREGSSEELVSTFTDIKLAFETLAKAMPKDGDDA
jgi:hypothetical protein